MVTSPSTLIKDWSDYKAVGSLIGVWDGTSREFQLSKRYSVGDSHLDRPIHKPVASSVTLYYVHQNQSQQYPISSFDVDANTGKVLITGSLPTNSEIYANFEFHVPVWFVNDTISVTLEGHDSVSGESVYRLNSLEIQEGRINSGVVKRGGGSTTHSLDLGNSSGLLIDTLYGSSIKQSIGGHLWTDNHTKRRFLIRVQDQIIDEDEKEELLNFFWVAKGRGISFSVLYKSNLTTMRFDSDMFILEYAHEGVYRTQGLNFIETIQSTTQTPLAPPTSNVEVAALVTADNYCQLYYGQDDRLEAVPPHIEQNRWDVFKTFNYVVQNTDYLYVVAWEVGFYGMWIGKFDFLDVTLVSNKTDWVFLRGSVRPGRNPSILTKDLIENDIRAGTWSDAELIERNYPNSPWGTISGINTVAKYVWISSFFVSSGGEEYVIFKSKKPISCFDQS